MRFLRALIQFGICLFSKNCEHIFVNILIFIKIIFPDITDFLILLNPCLVADDVSVTVCRLQIENEITARFNIRFHPAKKFIQFLLMKQIIHGIAHTEHRIYRAVQFHFFHVLMQIQNIGTALFLLLLRNRKHIHRFIQTNHVISGSRKFLRHYAGTASQFTDSSAQNTLLVQILQKIFKPCLIGNMIHHMVIYIGKSFIHHLNILLTFNCLTQ